MTDALSWLFPALAGLAGLALASGALLKGWQGWLDLKRFELDRPSSPAETPSPAARIEIADLKERIRKLEAIAAGVDL